jgi:hypothetical protein
MQELTHKTQRMNANMSHQISSLKQDVQDAIGSLEMKFTTQKDAKKAAQEAEEEAAGEGANERTKEEARAAWVHVNETSTISSDVSNLAQTLVESESNGATMVVSLTLLESLTFPQMDFRHSKVHEAHPNTFKEVFGSKILPWLRSSEPVFWVSGKPGSGKSTLMKYIVGNPEVRYHLQNSMRGQTPRIASYFFWINGTELQRSQEGLLQSLLYELLCQSPELIEVALPDLWQSTRALIRRSNQSLENTWKRVDLLAAIERLSRSKITANRLCIFIDGLDEYEGDHDNLIDTIKHLEMLGMKMCIASRPWNVFEESFGLNPECKIYLQDLNKADIELYVNDKLRNRPEFEKMRAASPGTDVLIGQLIEEVVEKSQGVFLWVFLVVKSLIDGLRNHDRLSQLQKRLRQFPGDLQQFFNHMFQSMDPVYHSQTAQMFQVALQVSKPPSPLLYYYLDELEDSPDLAFSMEIYAMGTSELAERIESSRKRINGRCKGLLEVTATDSAEDAREYYVDFLHRTVKDYLMTTEIRRVFISWQPHDFDTDLAICQSTLAEFKSCADRSGQALDALQNFFYAAKQLELKYEETPLQYLHELERVGELCRSRRGLSSEYPWHLLGTTCFLEAVIQADLLLFAETRRLEFPRLFGIPKSRSTNLFQIRNVSLDMVQLTLSVTSSSIGAAVPISDILEKDLIKVLTPKDDHEVLEWMKVICSYAQVFWTTEGHCELEELLQRRYPHILHEVEQMIGNATRVNPVKRKPARVELGGSTYTSKRIDGTGINKEALDAGPRKIATTLRTTAVRNDSNVFSGVGSNGGTQEWRPVRMGGAIGGTHNLYGSRTNGATQQTRTGGIPRATQDVYSARTESRGPIPNKQATQPGQTPSKKRGFLGDILRKIFH